MNPIFFNGSSCSSSFSSDNFWFLINSSIVSIASLIIQKNTLLAYFLLSEFPTGKNFSTFLVSSLVRVPHTTQKYGHIFPPVLAIFFFRLHFFEVLTFPFSFFKSSSLITSCNFSCHFKFQRRLVPPF